VQQVEGAAAERRSVSAADPGRAPERRAPRHVSLDLPALGEVRIKGGKCVMHGTLRKAA
jgi:hypothetical protein